MAEMIKKLSDATHHHTAKQSLHSPKTIINTITGYENNLGDQLEQLEREADIQAQEVELNECVRFVTELIGLFKHTVIISELQCQNDWHENLRHQLKNNKGNSGNHFLDYKVEKIAINKDLTKEQWNRLLYLTWTTNDITEITKVSKKHLQKVHDMASRLLEVDQQSLVFALINAIKKHMPKKYFIEN